MTWHPPVPRRVTDPAGSVWSVQRAWPGTSAGRYVLEVQSPGHPGVLGGIFRDGRFVPVYADDSKLPALALESPKGETVVHRAHKRAVLRAGGTYIKVFRPEQAPAAATNHVLATAVLAGGPFRTPVMTAARPDVLVFSRVAGRPYYELGQDRSTVPDDVFAGMWAHWSRAWAETVVRASGPVSRATVEQLPLHDAEEELVRVQRWIDHWLLHSEGIPEAERGRAALLAQADAVTARLLALPHDPLGWAHGDLHDKQILGGDHIPGTDNTGAPGLLDFDEACRAEAALDLANLAVHLELRRRQNLLSGRRFAIAHACIVSAATRLHVSPERFEAYAASARLRLACMYSFRPPWGSWAVRYLTSMDLVSPGLRRPSEAGATVPLVRPEPSLT
ncbi:phosphotransferase [Arthrobacter sp. NPDC056727]|uniref:phosphotransferase n=1 Tax=Arthrobacter sp. NPDC056727 TaxID=3345927 RepID=UPI00366F05D8